MIVFFLLSRSNIMIKVFLYNDYEYNADIQYHAVKHNKLYYITVKQAKKSRLVKMITYVS